MDVRRRALEVEQVDSTKLRRAGSGTKRPSKYRFQRNSCGEESHEGQAGTVRSYQRISSTEGGFTGELSPIDGFGIAIASLGDLDRDGVTDLAVGSPFNSEGSSMSLGAVWILFMNADGTVKAQQKISNSEGGFTGGLLPQSQFGSAIVNLGDLDGDDVTEIVVFGTGYFWVLFLNTDGTVKGHQRFGRGEGGLDGVRGTSMTALGDLDGDGVRDLGVGDFTAGGIQGAGAVWILFLNADGTVKAHQRIDQNEGGFTGQLDTADHFGTSVANLGDLDGDGVVDLATGAAYDDDGTVGFLGRGAVWILFLNPDGTVKGQQKISDLQGGFTGELDDGDTFGSSVTPLGDLDADGVTDLAVGAYADDDGSPARGAVWVLFLERDGTVKAHQKISDSEGNFSGVLGELSWFGQAMASMVDLDGDGLRELAVSGSNFSDSLFHGFWILSLEGLLALHFEHGVEVETPLVNGQKIEANDVSRAVRIRGLEPTDFGPAIFDSTPDGPNAQSADPDLLVDLGNVLILQEDPALSEIGIFEFPDDNRSGGTLAFDLERPMEVRSIDLIDICPSGLPQDVTLTLYDEQLDTRTFHVPTGWTSDVTQTPPGYGTLDLTTLEPQPGFASTATASEELGFGPTRVKHMLVSLSGSGALDNVLFDPHPPAQTVYVDATNENCPGTGTQVDPFCSLQHAIEFVPDGSTILVAPGTIHEAATLEFRSGLTLQGAGIDETTILAPGSASAIQLIGCTDITIRGFRIRTEFGGFSLFSGAINLGSSTGVKIFENFITEPHGAGLRIAGISSAEVFNNVFASFDSAGILIASGPSTSVIYHNTLVGTPGPLYPVGVWVQTSQSLAYVYNNIIYGNHTNLSGLPESVFHDYNVIGGATVRDYQFLVREPNEPDCDPMFVDAGALDFRLMPGSCAQDAGTDLIAPGTIFERMPPTTDFEGDTRPSGGGFDMGADEIAIPKPIRRR